MNITMESFHYSKWNPPVCRFLTQIRVIDTVKPHWDYKIVLVKLLSSIHPSILNQTFANRIQYLIKYLPTYLPKSNKLNPWIEFDWVRQSNEIEHWTLCEKSNPIELNPLDCVQLSLATGLNWTQSNELSSIGFDCTIFCVSLISFDCRTQLNPWIGFDWLCRDTLIMHTFSDTSCICNFSLFLRNSMKAVKCMVSI